MARRIKDAFAGGKAFIAFITAGDPNLAATEEYILEMEGFRSPIRSRKA